ncbi:MAG: hypothetical protein WCR42_09195 [bacterium]
MKLKHITLIISAIVLLSFTGCKDMQNPVGTDTPEYAIVLNNAVEIDGDLATTQVVECSLESNAFIPGDQSIFENCRFGREDMDKRCPPKGGPKDRPMIGKVMRELKLTAEQIELLKGFNLAHRDCIELTMQTWRDAVAPIMEKANAERKLIMDDLKNKVITRREAYDKLNVLNKAMRAEIDALGMKDTIKLAIEDCNKTLLDSIYGMLTPEQQIIWDKYFPNK